MTQPTVITVPAGAGVTGGGSSIQIPSVSSGSPTIVNLDKLLSLTLCPDTNFNPGNIFTLAAGQSLPIANGNGMNVMNSNNLSVSLLIIDGIVPVGQGNTAIASGLSPALISKTATGNYQILPAPPAGFIYRLQSVVWQYINASIAVAAFTITAFIGTTGSTYFDAITIPAMPATSGLEYAQKDSLEGQACNGPVYLALNNTPGTGALTAQLNYDLVPA